MLMWFGAQLAHKKSWMVSVIYDYNNNYVFLAMINQLFALITKEKLRQTVSQGKIINVLVVLWGILIDYCDFALKNIVWFFCQFFQWIYQILRFQTSQSSSRHNFWLSNLSMLFQLIFRLTSADINWNVQW